MTHTFVSDAGIDTSEYDITSSVRNIAFTTPIPRRGGAYRVGEPYVIAGRTYTPREEPDYRAEGTASWYGDKFHGRLTANGEVFDTFALSAAHPTLPLPSYVRVTNLENNRSLVVRLNDRGPFFDNRLIDVSVKTAKLLGFYDQGIAKVRVDYIGPAELGGSDEATLMATLRGDDVTPVAADAPLTVPVPEIEKPESASAAFAPSQTPEIEKPETVAVESAPAQSPEIEIPPTVIAGLGPTQVSDSEPPATVTASFAPAQPRECDVPVNVSAAFALLRPREPEPPEMEIAEPVIVLIPQVVAWRGDADADSVTGVIRKRSH